jgi:PAS domain S-box-containing protein
VQQELEESRSEYKNLFDCAPVGYVMLTVTGEMLRANRVALRLFGLPRVSWPGQKLASFVVPEDRPRLQQYTVMAQSDTPIRGEVTLRNCEGLTYPVQLDMSLVPNSELNCLVVLTDVSRPG